MIYKDFKLPIIEYISAAEEIPNLVSIILFGSAITGDVSKKSDIDLLLVFECSHNPEIGEEAKVSHQISARIEKKYDLKHSFSFSFYNLRNQEEIDPDFIWEISQDGFLIWARPNLLTSQPVSSILEPKVICTYSFIGLKDKNKRNIIRKLYKNKSSLLNEKEEKIAPGVLLIEASKLKRVKELFDEYDLRDYSIKRVWTR